MECILFCHNEINYINFHLLKLLRILYFAGVVQKPKSKMAETEEGRAGTDPEITRGTCKQEASRGLQHGSGSYVTSPSTKRG